MLDAVAAIAQAKLGPPILLTRGESVVGSLVPMLPTEANSVLAAKWRNENREAYSSIVTATPESILQWLKSFYLRDDRILFLVLSAEYQPVGHFGAVLLDPSTAEIVSAVRGSELAVPGLFYIVYHTVTRWLFSDAQVKKAVACALDSNPKPTRIMARCGYRVVGADPVNLVTNGAVSTWTVVGDERMDHTSRLMVRLECLTLLPRNDPDDTLT